MNFGHRATMRSPREREREATLDKATGSWLLAMALTLPYRGMACAISDNALYALGGNQGMLGFRRDLGHDAEWEPFNATLEIGMHPSVAPSDTGLFVFEHQTILFFDPPALAWHQGPSLAERHVGSGLVRNDLIPTEYITFFNSSMHMFDSVRYRWSTSSSERDLADANVVAMHGGILYVLANATVHLQDMRTGEWRSRPAAGALPPSTPRLPWTQHKGWLFVVSEDSLYVLDLPILRWSKHRIDGLQAGSDGCLVYHDETLVHAFGIARSGQPISVTQRIDVREFKLVGPRAVPYTPIAIAAGLVLLLAAVGIRRLARRKPDQGLLDPPALLTHPQWSDTSLAKYTPNLNCTFYPEVDDAPSSVFARRRIYSISIATPQYSSVCKATPNLMPPTN